MVVVIARGVIGGFLTAALMISVGAPSPASAAPSCPVSYVVKRGDSPWKVAQKTRPTGWTVAKASGRIAKMNPRQSSWMVGRSICLPAGSGGATPTTSTPSVAPAPGRTYTKAEIRRMIRDAFPDGEAEEVAIYVAIRESNLRPTVKSRCCSGLFQIYYKWHKSRLARLGIRSEADLLDPVLNIRAAADIYRTNGWGPWCTRALKAKYPNLRACR